MSKDITRVFIILFRFIEIVSTKIKTYSAHFSKQVLHNKYKDETIYFYSNFNYFYTNN